MEAETRDASLSVLPAQAGIQGGRIGHFVSEQPQAKNLTRKRDPRSAQGDKAAQGTTFVIATWHKTV